LRAEVPKDRGQKENKLQGARTWFGQRRRLNNGGGRGQHSGICKLEAGISVSFRSAAEESAFACSTMVYTIKEEDQTPAG
jgi:hypothetical protein